MGNAKLRRDRGEMPYQQKDGGRDRDARVHSLASAIDERVRQIEAATPDVGDRALMNLMAAFLPSLHEIWTTTSDNMLADLCSRYPGFYRYARVMEDAFEAQRQNPSAFSIPPAAQALPESVRPVFMRLLTNAAHLETEFHSLVEMAQQLVTLGRHVSIEAMETQSAKAHAVGAMHKQWIAGLTELADALDAAGVPPATAQLLAKGLTEMNERMGQLNERFLQLALAGRAATNPDSDEPVQ